MTKTSVSIEIRRSSDEVFDFMSDLAKMAVWTDMQRMDLNGPLAAGTTGTFDMPMMGRRRTLPFVITAYEKGRRWGIRVTNRLGLAFEYVLVPTPAGTRVDEAIELSPNGFLRLVAPVLTPMIRSEELGELRRLKEILEAPIATA